MWFLPAILVPLLAWIAPVDGVNASAYIGRKICLGTKPVLFKDDGANVQLTKARFEPYWEQFQAHVSGCEIIIGNLIIPHLHGVPFEKEKITAAVKSIIEITGYLFMYDVKVDVNFMNLRVIHGKELLNDPGLKTAPWSQKFALFFQDVTSKVTFPALKFIGDGMIGIKQSPHVRCYFHVDKLPALFEEYSYEEMATYRHGKRTEDVLKMDSTGTCGSGEARISIINMRHEKCQIECRSGYCLGADSTDANAVISCCPVSCRGGCKTGHTGTDRDTAGVCLACHPDQYMALGSQTNNLCVSLQEVTGPPILGTNYYFPNSAKVVNCPDYMFRQSVAVNDTDKIEACTFKCLEGYEYNPLQDVPATSGLEALPKHPADLDGHLVCRRCGTRFGDDGTDFVSDCGIGCTLQTASLSYFTILNIYPAITEARDFKLSTLKEILPMLSLTANRNTINKYNEMRKCDYIYGRLSIDQYSVGYPLSGARLLPQYFEALTFVTAVYGRIRVENTEGFWNVDAFRNILAVVRPKKGRHFTDSDDIDIRVRYNSDLRTLDLQRLSFIDGQIVVKFNPLYIPPFPPSTTEAPKKVFRKRNKEYFEQFVSVNGLLTTRTAKVVTYDSGCQKGGYYNGRCILCNDGFIRSFTKKRYQLFATCQREASGRSKCGRNQYYHTELGEAQCLDCAAPCGDKGCLDGSPSSCGKKKVSDPIVCGAGYFKVVSETMEVCASKCPYGFYFDNTTTECHKCHENCRSCVSSGFEYGVDCDDCDIIGTNMETKKQECWPSDQEEDCEHVDGLCTHSEASPFDYYFDQLVPADE